MLSWETERVCVTLRSLGFLSFENSFNQLSYAFDYQTQDFTYIYIYILFLRVYASLFMHNLYKYACCDFFCALSFSWFLGFTFFFSFFNFFLFSDYEASSTSWNKKKSTSWNNLKFEIEVTFQFQAQVTSLLLWSLVGFPFLIRNWWRALNWDFFNMKLGFSCGNLRRK